MTIRLTGTEDFGEFCKDVQLFNDYEGKSQLSTWWFGQYSFRCTSLRYNLGLGIHNNEYSQPVIFEQKHNDFPELTSKFFLSGGTRTVTPNVAGVSDDYDEVAGYNYLFSLPDVLEFEHFPANQHTQCISIYWYPDLLESFQGSFEELPVLLQQLRENSIKQPFHQPLGVTTPAMRLVLKQILQCPLRETLRLMYLEAKVLELLALQIAQWEENHQVLRRSLHFRPDEIECLHHAKAILNQTLDNPPSLLNLAKEIGLNDFKLKRGFREVFGTTVLGYVQFLRLEQAKQRFFGFGVNLPPLDTANPDYDISTDRPHSYDYNQQYNSDSYGLYLQDQIDLLDNLILVLGGRYDWITIVSSDFAGGTVDINPVGAFSPRIGIVYQPIETLSLYANYSRSLATYDIGGHSRTGETFEPQRSTQYEAGIKADFLGGRLSALLAAYQLTRTNVLVADPLNTPDEGFSIQIGEQRSRGADFSVQGEILPGWNVIGGYSYIDARYTKDNRPGFEVGSPVALTPNHSANLWTTYRIQSGNLQGLGFGFGVYFVGDLAPVVIICRPTTKSLPIPDLMRLCFTDVTTGILPSTFNTIANLRGFNACRKGMNTTISSELGKNLG
ncbi:TonB-dependent receptor domain-containing protein [Nostoc sp.]|uniref:TonB-dependent receptor domain-containing protein n=1 Tax=Nostoc sp. TaxID=1180 RepID=UPI002FFD4A9D